VIRLLIAAQSAVVRAGLEALIASSPGVKLLGSFADLSVLEELQPDVVLATLPAGDLPPLSDARQPAFVLLTHDSRTDWTQDAIRRGVRAILPPEASAAAILAAVEAAAAGLAAVDASDLEALVSSSAPVRDSGETPILTARELEVLRLVAEGTANKTIAWKMGISEHTVKFHVASILGKLNASTRTEAVAIGIRRGLVLL
jgi:DNA-binding NarL/FixJ family response regulator